MIGQFERYIAGAVARSTVVTLLVLVILLVFFTLVEELRDLGKGDYSLLDILLVSAMAAPRYLYELFPAAAMLGSLLGLGALASNSELMAMRAAGFSRTRIVLTVLGAGAAMIALVVLVGEWVAPQAERFATQYKFEQSRQQATLQSNFGFWTREGDTYINIRDASSDYHLRDIFIYEINGQGRLSTATYAESADFAGEHWVLKSIDQSHFFDNKVTTEHVASARWEAILDPSLLNLFVSEPDVLPMWKLWQYIDFMQRSGQSAEDYQVAFWIKAAMPMATLAMLLLAIPFVLANQRTVSLGQRIFVGSVVGASFFLLNRAMSFAAVVYQFDPALGAMAPILLVTGVAVVLLRRIR